MTCWIKHHNIVVTLLYRPVVSIYFADEEKVREYYGNSKVWLAGIQENQLPLVVSDILYVLKSVIQGE